ncbi:MAG: AraC family transcriptional regulator [Porphyrobacter sp.]|nr:AraC family transcriptional regulator [Porphyrobacter sp.]
MHQIRAVTLSGYVEVATFVGLDGKRMLRDAGVSWQALEDPENRLPATTVIGLLEDSAARSGCDSFGLLMAETRSFASIGPLSLLLERLPNLREAVRTAIEFQRHLNDIVALSLEEAGETCLIRLDLVPGHGAVQALDLSIGYAYRVLAAASGNRWRPASVHLTHPAPADIAPWRRFFAAPIEFESSFNGFSTSRDALLAPNPRADPAMAGNARRLLELVPLEPMPASVSERVRRSITVLLPSGRANVDVVATTMGVSRRSLQRSLREEGHRFGELLDLVRRELATAHLAHSSQPITSVSAMLGYGSPSSFTRWFAGAFGTSPNAWRESHKAGRRL